MRASRLAAFAAAVALAGAVAALGIGAAAGWIGARHTRTLVIEKTLAPPASATVPAVQPAARPLVGNGFDPAAIYSSRSAGVVTIYSYFGGHAAQGSGFVVSQTGVVLTNSHVITDAGEGSPGSRVHPAEQVYLEFADRDRVPAKIVGWDVYDDVGVVRVDPRAHRLSPVPLRGSAPVALGGRGG